MTSSRLITTKYVHVLAFFAGIRGGYYEPLDVAVPHFTARWRWRSVQRDGTARADVIDWVVLYLPYKSAATTRQLSMGALWSCVINGCVVSWCYQWVRCICSPFTSKYQKRFLHIILHALYMYIFSVRNFLFTRLSTIVCSSPVCTHLHITSDVYTLRFVFSVKHTRYDFAAMVEFGVVGDHQHPRRARHDHPADVPQANQ